MGPSIISTADSAGVTSAPSSVGMLTSVPCKMVTCAEVDENLYRGSLDGVLIYAAMPQNLCYSDNRI